MTAVRPKIDVYPHASYVTTSAESCRKHKDQTALAKLQRMKARFDKFGVIRSVEAVLLVHAHDHPHVLLLESKLGQQHVYRLPGGKVRCDEPLEQCLLRKLRKKMFHDLEDDAPLPVRVGELVSTWVRPNFDPLMYPYKPVHVAQEKEARFVYLVHLEPEATLSVPSDYKLVSAPVFGLYDNAAQFGAVIAGVPHCLSRFHVNLC